MKPNITEELSFAINLAKQAGESMRTQLNLPKKVEWKADNTPVTEVDIMINRLVIDQIKAHYPADGVLGEEESYEEGRSRLWVVDPIDGTQPFEMGVPLSTFSLGLVIDGEPVLGVVYDPYLDRMYQAVKGEGATVNGAVLHVSAATELAHQSLFVSSRMGGKFVSTGVMYDRIIEAKAKAFNFRSIVYSCMVVASGNAAGCIVGSFKPWDAAAAVLILREAGATVTDLYGGELVYDQIENGMLIATPGVAEAFRRLLD